MRKTLYIAATPVGNLQDMNIRTVEILKNADLVLCEDTRTSKVLLDAYDIQVPLKSLHRHNEAAQCDFIIKKLLDGETIVLIADAGTPVIRDAGRILIAQAHAHNIHVSPLPGACSVTMALSCCGFDGDQFVFEGFLPSKSREKIKRLRKLSTETRTIVCFETPHRLSETINNIKEIFGNNRNICLVKELTKVYEAVICGNIDKVIEWLSTDKSHSKGEFVIIFESKKKESQSVITIEAVELLELLSDYMTPSVASGIVSKLSHIPRQELYKKVYRK